MATWKIHAGEGVRELMLGEMETEIVERAISTYLQDHSGLIVRAAFADTEPGAKTSLWVHASTPQSFVYRAAEDREEVERLSDGILKMLLKKRRLEFPDPFGPL